MSKQEKDPIYRYKGTHADVFWDERLCIHVGECGRAQGDLFVGGRDPWCQPDEATVSDVAEVCARCPTGALTYVLHDDDGPEPTAPEQNSIVVANCGPLYASGDLHVQGAPADMKGIRFRAALCRCGHSKNKPFCDNSHEDAGFKDYGAVGERGDGNEDAGGPLTITSAPDGPLVVSGNFAIISSSGRVAWTGTKAALCRCGESKNRPFCDGEHKRIGFKSD